ncbi:DUF4177 domain-containing protein [Arundinibacter roseus]|uniref:DUF4177 domain-containing protein n=1 Tax=Arundinibacter roseus TaxID=2070510 RepID=A0A4R4K4J2_9BACT|nr:DUF4177 domain-containing protein [Arundinibacter roseus]TDB62374.1 DUF4177 domain-containing protein [Arundinibacter roseus]
MKEYKVESRIYYSKFTFNINHIIEKSTPEFQALLDSYAQQGWTLNSTTSTSFGSAMYFYFYFERDIPA